MGTTHLNVRVRDSLCKLIKTGWMVDLAVLTCDGTPLYELDDSLLPALKKKYCQPATVRDFTAAFPLTDQGGRTLEVTVSGVLQTMTFTTGTTKLGEIFDQIRARVFTGVTVDVVDGHLVLETDERGPGVTLSVSGDCDLDWGPVTQGSGYEIYTHYYHDAYRIRFRPTDGSTINHVELDVPNGCYKIFARVCFGDNEDTSVVFADIEGCGKCRTIDLMLPKVMKCSKDILYPAMHQIVRQGIDPVLDNRVVVMGALAKLGNLGRDVILAELAARRVDAELLNRADLVAELDDIIEVANALPQCC